MNSIEENPDFRVGDVVALRSDRSRVGAVIDVLDGGVEIRYRVLIDGTISTFYGSQLVPGASTEEYSAELSAEECKALLTALHIRSPSTSALMSLRSGRVEFVPYQYRPVLKLIRSDRPRLLIADEVGVGKTIEAGLIIKELRARSGLSSILIICPKPLVSDRKWELEMRRFDEHLHPLDGPALRFCIHETHLDGEWPRRYSNVILPMSLLNEATLFGKARPKGRTAERGLIDLDPPPNFDLVIVDEAHHARNPETHTHQAIRFFCQNAEAVVFLTATPVQMGSQDLFSLLNLLRPDLIIDPPTFEQMAAPNGDINRAIALCRSAPLQWREEVRSCLNRAVVTDWGRSFLQTSPLVAELMTTLEERGDEDERRVRAINALEGLYTFGTLINRTRRRDIGEFTIRKPRTVAISYTAAQRVLHDRLMEVLARILAACHGHQNVSFMMSTVRRQAASCLYGLAPYMEDILNRNLDRLEGVDYELDQSPDLGFVDRVRGEIESLIRTAHSLDPVDPKADAFRRVIREKLAMPRNKALVFSTFRHTLAYLGGLLEEDGVRFEVIHGDVPERDRRDIRSRFSLPKESRDAVDVLLSSEVGCEGLDFQFCDMLVNYDLPWNPMRIEQRIGRLDRHGQESQAIAIVNLVTPDTVDYEIYDRCLLRLGIFEHAIGGNEEILGELGAELQSIGESLSLTRSEVRNRLRQLADNVIRRRDEDERIESAQGELFGLGQVVADWKKEVEDAESPWTTPTAIQRCVNLYLQKLLESPERDFFAGSGPVKTLRLGADAKRELLAHRDVRGRRTDPRFTRWEDWLRGTSTRLSVTFQQEAARTSDEVVHLDVTHSLVQQAASFLTEDGEKSKIGPTRVRVEALSSKAPVGEHTFAVYQWRKTGVVARDEFIAVCSSAQAEGTVMSLLAGAGDDSRPGQIDEFALDAMEHHHHELWSSAKERHVVGNRRIVEHRLQSLKASQRAREKMLREQLTQAEHENIRRMRTSQLERAKQDYEETVSRLRASAEEADILASVVVHGTMRIRRETA
ncbi:MAG: DEAD/DEAH box helicase [Caldilineaceae bacterium SB0662_bin_9]|uniref:DEAD/DEAH box helicase n=1 Tax=Caldilineaceae bacterium SB0662_bin_9 TaxID=2605258 RepID=A0A6B1DY10_9CHLR|nr:DEAD/DEAH box helicase [Caldilineaceae bacterium SB0662_bin_9]